MLDVDPADELAQLVGQLKNQLARHYAAGSWAAPGGLTARVEGPVVDTSDVEPVGDESVGAHVVEPIGDEPVVQVGRRGLPQIRAELGDCTRCKLHSTRKSIVFGVGDPNAALMFVGEAPGEQEDKRGEPFVGPAGELLDKMIEAMGWSRQTVYINNILACRPPGNRNPQPDEVAACKPFLEARIRAIAPRIIVALGRPASNQLLGIDAPIGALRGRFHDYPRFTLDRHSLKIMPTFHPAYLLRDPDKKRMAWADLKLVMAELVRLGIPAPSHT
jgi:uracil-DNA glycosylase